MPDAAPTLTPVTHTPRRDMPHDNGSPIRWSAGTTV